MAEHRVLSDPDLHEPKGASTASQGTVYTSDGNGSGSWESPRLSGQGSALEGELPVSDGLGGVSWGNVLVRAVDALTARDFNDQEPSGTDSPLQVKFGPSQSNAFFTLDAAGKITCNKSGTYLAVFQGRVGRTSGAGESVIALRYLIDGVQVGASAAQKMPDDDITVPFVNTVSLNLTVGQEITVEFIRDSAGNDNGGLFSFNTTPADWEDAPSTSLNIFSLEV